jgi:hypothetical protein
VSQLQAAAPGILGCAGAGERARRAPRVGPFTHRSVGPVGQAVCPKPRAPRHVIETGLDLTGRVQGRLHGRFPSDDGDWFGVVNYEITYADGCRDKVQLVDQLLPFCALRRREQAMTRTEFDSGAR